MPSPAPSERRWSLTRRLSQRFAIVAAAVLALYALLNGYFLLAELREDFKDFMEHELAEVEFGIRSRDGTPEGIAAAVHVATAAPSEPPYAIRVRRHDGTVITQGGDATLLGLVPETLPEDPSWREFLISRGVTIGTEDLDGLDANLEMIVDSKRLTDEMRQYVTYALISFVVAVSIAAFAGWLTARHSLRSLREVVMRAEQIRSPDEAKPIRLEDAPQEIFDVGNALNRMIERVHDALFRLRTFTAGLAHELRSPLQNLIGETEVT
ncbi:MAG: HAMP domain-containing protein, partial [Planctomycetes bacterium]|nr:HAMP domain-containing protein [Planctomycetota bacterium]